MEQVVVTATAQGAYAAPLLLQAGNYGASQITNQAGYQEYTRYSVPYVYAILGKPPGYTDRVADHFGDITNDANHRDEGDGVEFLADGQGWRIF